MQRRKTLARRGEEIGLKAPSQPTGTFSRDCCAGAAGAPILDVSPGTVSGKRSPLNARSTSGGFTVNKPLPGADANEIKLAVKIATAATAARTNQIGRIEAHSDDS
jgi:hypothetical protein